MSTCKLLTPCEAECLAMRAEGMPASEIAAIRGGSKRTVNFHLANAYRKLGVNNSIRAVSKARELGEID